MNWVLIVLMAFFAVSCADQQPNTVSDVSDEVIVNEVKCTAGEFSPDGKFIAFTGEKYKGLFIKDLSTNEIVKITDADGAGWRFSWSPDSQGITFRETEYLEKSATYKIMKRFLNKESNELVGEFENAVWPPLWKDTIYSVDTVRSSNIALAVKPLSILKNPAKPMKFNAFTSNNLISLIDLKTGTLKNLEEGTHSPSISEDGRFVLFIHLDTIKVLDTVKNTTIEIGRGSSPSWVSGSKKIVYTSTLDDGKNITFSQIFLFDVNSRVSEIIAVPAERIPLAPAISHDGSKLLYTDYITGHLFIKQLGNEK
jgi:hypothetical protein